MKQIDKKQVSKALFKNTGIIAIGQVGTKLLNFLLLPLYTALLSSAEYGLVDLLNTGTSLIVIVVNLQLEEAIFRFITSIRDEKEKVSNMTKTILSFSILLLSIYMLLFNLFKLHKSIDYSWYLGVYVIAYVYLSSMSSITRGLGKNNIYAIGNFISSTIIVLLNVLLVAVLKKGVLGMLLASIFGTLIGATYLLFKAKIYNYFIHGKFEFQLLKPVLKYSIPLIPNALSWWVIHASDRMIVSNFLGIAANGLIAVATKFSYVYTVLFSLFSYSWTEQIILHYKEEGSKDYVSQMFKDMAVVFACIAMGIIAILPFVFSLLVSNGYEEAYNLTFFYLVAVYFNVIIGLLGPIYLAENRTGTIAMSTFIAASINLLVNVFLIGYIGVYAAPISSILGYGIVSLWRCVSINSKYVSCSMPLGKISILLIMLLILAYSHFSRNIIIQLMVLFLIIIVSFHLNKKWVVFCVDCILRRK